MGRASQRRPGRCRLRHSLHARCLSGLVLAGIVTPLVHRISFPAFTGEAGRSLGKAEAQSRLTQRRESLEPQAQLGSQIAAGPRANGDFEQDQLLREPMEIIVTSDLSPLQFLDGECKLDPYEVLGVRFLAPLASIKAAYKEKCRKLHPDLNGGEESVEWKLVHKAYGMLSNTEDKIAYDSSRLFRAIWTLGSTGVAGVLDWINAAADVLGASCVRFLRQIWVGIKSMARSAGVAGDLRAARKARSSISSATKETARAFTMGEHRSG